MIIIQYFCFLIIFTFHIFQISDRFEIDYPLRIQKFLENWDILKTTLPPIFLSKGKPLEAVGWTDETILLLLKLMQLLPSSQRVRRDKPKNKDSSEYLLMFRKHDTTLDDVKKTLQKNSIKQPLILCSGENKSNVHKFNVIIDQDVLSESDSALSAFNLLFQSFFVFDIEFPTALLSFYQFVQFILYGFAPTKKFKKTSRMLEIESDLFGSRND